MQYFGLTLELKDDPDVIANALRDLANVDLGPQLSRLTVPLHVVFAGSTQRSAAPMPQSKEGRRWRTDERISSYMMFKENDSGPPVVSLVGWR